jgi:hypothetical protein
MIVELWSSAKISALSSQWFKKYGYADQPSKDLYDGELLSNIEALKREDKHGLLVFTQCLLCRDLTTFAMDFLAASVLEDILETTSPMMILTLGDLSKNSVRFRELLEYVSENDEMHPDIRNLLRSAHK